MYDDFLGDDTRATMALLECITREGVHQVNIDGVARQLGRSRTTMYRQYGNWRGLLKHAHTQVLQILDDLVQTMFLERREAFDKWWSAVAQMLRTANGRAFRALRGQVAEDEGVERLTIDEVMQLRSLVLWTGNDLVAHRVWVLMLASTGFPAEDPAADTLRELAWSQIATANTPRQLTEKTVGPPWDDCISVRRGPLMSGDTVVPTFGTTVSPWETPPAQWGHSCGHSCADVGRSARPPSAARRHAAGDDLRPSFRLCW
jgi:AcrR family transcriptional regulator